MPSFIDLTHHKFGRLTVLSRVETDMKTQIQWACRCDCGIIRHVFGNALRSGRTLSCGCLHAEQIRTHGKTKTPEFTVWQMMRQRCNNPRHRSYPSYGGRGIKVCHRWENSFTDFLADMGKRPSKSFTLDRVDNDAGYSPHNCQWATPKKQGRNKRSTHLISYNGEQQSIGEWARRLGMVKSTLARRLKRWSVEDAFTQPPSRTRLEWRNRS